LGARSHSGAKDFLFDGCQAHALFLAEDFGVTAADKAPVVPRPEALDVSDAEKVPVVPSQDGRSDPGVTQPQVLSENNNGRIFEGNAKAFFAYAQGLMGLSLSGDITGNHGGSHNHATFALHRRSNWRSGFYLSGTSIGTGKRLDVCQQTITISWIKMTMLASRLCRNDCCFACKDVRS
jgi:hypothetical protein